MYVSTISITNFQIMTNCIFVGQIYVINWISGVGNNLVYAKEGASSSTFGMLSPLVFNMDPTPSIAYTSIPSLMGWNFISALNFNL